MWFHQFETSQTNTSVISLLTLVSRSLSEALDHRVRHPEFSDAPRQSPIQVSEISCSQHAPVYNELDDVTDSLAGFHVTENERPVPTHSCRVPLHYLKRGTHQRGHVDLIDHQQVALRYAWPALSRDLVPGADVDDVDGKVRQFWRKRGAEIIATRLNQDQLEPLMSFLEFINRGKVHRRILTNRRVWTSTGLDTQNPRFVQRVVASQKLSILVCVDIVRDHGHVVVVTHR